MILEKVRAMITFLFCDNNETILSVPFPSANSRYASSMKTGTFSETREQKANKSFPAVMLPTGLFGLQMYTIFVSLSMAFSMASKSCDQSGLQGIAFQVAPVASATRIRDI